MKLEESMLKISQLKNCRIHKANQYGSPDGPIPFHFIRIGYTIGLLYSWINAVCKDRDIIFEIDTVV